MGNTGSSERPGTGVLAALVIVFLPGMFGVPILFLLVLALVGAAAGLALLLFPHFWTQVSDWAILASAGVALLVATGMQVHAWWRLRADVSVVTNGLIVIIFTLYVAMAAGGVRFALAKADRSAFRWSEELVEARRKVVSASLESQLKEVPSRLSVVAAMRSNLLTCNIAVVSTVADHVAFWRGQIDQLLTNNRNARCTVWVWSDSNLKRLLPHPSRDDGPLVSVQRGTISGPHVWFSETVGLVPETFPDFPADARPVIELAYEEPRTADLGKLLDLQVTYERRREARLNSELCSASDRGIQPPFSFIQFALASIGQFVGAFGDMLKPVSPPAQIFDIMIGLLRTMFALIFFERLVKTRRE